MMRATGIAVAVVGGALVLQGQLTLAVIAIVVATVCFEADEEGA